MRFLPSLLAVEFLRTGMPPQAAGEKAMERIRAHFPTFMGGIVVVTKDGDYGAACNGIAEFPFSVATGNTSATIKTVQCKNGK